MTAHTIREKPVCGELCGAKYINSHHIKINCVSSVYQHLTTVSQFSLDHSQVVCLGFFFYIFRCEYRRNKSTSQCIKNLQLLMCRLYCKDNCKISVI